MRTTPIGSPDIVADRVIWWPGAPPLFRLPFRFPILRPTCGPQRHRQRRQCGVPRKPQGCVGRLWGIDDRLDGYPPVPGWCPQGSRRDMAGDCKAPLCRTWHIQPAPKEQVEALPAQRLTVAAALSRQVCGLANLPSEVSNGDERRSDSPKTRDQRFPLQAAVTTKSRKARRRPQRRHQSIPRPSQNRML